MKKTLKILGLLVLGALLGYALLIGGSLLTFLHRAKSPGFLAASTLQSTAPSVMSNPELQIWNDMRDKIRKQRYAEVNDLIGLGETDIEFAVTPAKETFRSGEAVLAEIRIRNVSAKALHVNEPRSTRLTLGFYDYQGYHQDDYSLELSPYESTWMKTLKPGEKLSLPTLIETTNTGPHKISYALAAFTFTDQGDQHSVGRSPVIKRAACFFDVTK